MSDQQCCFCKEFCKSLLKCSACGGAVYCNTNCQKSDWKKHKKNCRSFKVVALSKKGFGMISVRKICQGENILSEDPIFILSKNKKDRQKGPSLMEQFENLSEMDQSKVLKLHHENPDGKLSEKIQRIFESNTIEVTPANAVALYPTIPRCRLSMSLGAGFLRWVLACRTIEKKLQHRLHKVVELTPSSGRFGNQNYLGTPAGNWTDTLS